MFDMQYIMRLYVAILLLCRQGRHIWRGSVQRILVWISPLLQSADLQSYTNSTCSPLAARGICKRLEVSVLLFRVLAYQFPGSGTVEGDQDGVDT